MLQIGNEVYDKTNFVKAQLAMYTKLGAEAPKGGSPQRALLGNLILLAASDAAMFLADDVEKVYNDLVTGAKLNAATSIADRAWCLANQNKGTDNRLAAALDRQTRVLADSTTRKHTPLATLQAEGGTVVITRGTSPSQARKILENVTFGGLPLNNDIVEPPQVKDADAQTGYGVKDTPAGRIEEWSLLPQQGFATGGIMLVAEADVRRVTLPKTNEDATMGEAGVCGYAAARLLCVGILNEGLPFEGQIPLEQREFERLNAAVGAKQIDVVQLLKNAVQNRGGDH